jgi:hypothetical protein
VIAIFDRVTSRFGEVSEAVNSRFGTSFEPFPHADPSATERVFGTLVAVNRSWGVAEKRGAVPGHGREERAAPARSMLDDLHLGTLARRCEAPYARFAELERKQAQTAVDEPGDP